jgi:hypothetical protein
MKFRDEDVTIQPGYCARTWQSCDYYVGETHLFHERVAMRMPAVTLRKPNVRLRHPLTPAETFWLAFGPESVPRQWMPGGGTRAEMQTLADKHGGYIIEAFYAPEGADDWFLAFRDTDKALAFCRTEDFDRLLSMEKMG